MRTRRTTARLNTFFFTCCHVGYLTALSDNIWYTFPCRLFVYNQIKKSLTCIFWQDRMETRLMSVSRLPHVFMHNNCCSGAFQRSKPKKKIKQCSHSSYATFRCDIQLAACFTLVKKRRRMGGLVIGWLGWLARVRGVEKLWENGIPPKHWRPYEIEPNSLECRFRLDMSIKIKLIVIAGGLAPRWSNEKKTGGAPTGKSPPSAVLAISYIFIWMLTLARAREPLCVPLWIKYVFVCTAVRACCSKCQGAHQHARIQWQPEEKLWRESEWGVWNHKKVFKARCRCVQWWKVTGVTENQWKNAQTRNSIQHGSRIMIRN